MLKRYIMLHYVHMRPFRLYASIKEFALLQRVFSYNAIRAIRRRCKENGFESAFIKVGKRVMIDVDEFWECARTKAKPIVREK